MIIIRNEEKYLKTGENTAVNKEVFENMFGDSYDYDTLKNHEKAEDRWKDIFDYWKEENFI